MLLAAAQSSGGNYLLPVMIAAYAAFYFFYLRPRSKKARAAREKVNAVEVGDKAQSIGGIIGTVVSIDDHVIVLRTASGNEIEFNRKAVNQRYVEPVVAEPESNEGEAEGTSN